LFSSKLSPLRLCGVVLTIVTNQAIGADIPELALRATARVTGGGRSGTGFFVKLPDSSPGKSSTVFVTASHALEEITGPKGTLILRAGNEADGYHRREVELPLRTGEERLWMTHPTTDMAVIGVTLPDDVDVQPFELRQIAEAKHLAEKVIRVGQDVLIPCFPAQVEANPAGWPILRKGSLATHPLTPVERVPTIFVDYSHFGGDSGAPVIATVNDEPLVVGLVFAMLRITDKSTTTFEDRTIHMPLGLGIAVQGPLIRQTIDAWKAK